MTTTQPFQPRTAPSPRMQLAPTLQSDRLRAARARFGIDLSAFVEDGPVDSYVEVNLCVATEVARCENCRTVQHPTRTECLFCESSDVRLFATNGRGRIEQTAVVSSNSSEAVESVVLVSFLDHPDLVVAGYLVGSPSGDVAAESFVGQTVLMSRREGFDRNGAVVQMGTWTLAKAAPVQAA
jgi:uncharacterized OB-fold protein